MIIYLVQFLAGSLFLHLAPFVNSAKCPAGQTGTECTTIQINSPYHANAAGNYILLNIGTKCTGRNVYHNPQLDTYLAYTHVDFWPYLSAWMVFAKDPRSFDMCTQGKFKRLEEFSNPGVLIYLQTSDLTTAHRNDKTWKALSNRVFYDSDTSLSSKCIQGCVDCSAGKYSRGCDRLSLTLDRNTFVFPPDVDRLSGTYERLYNGAGEHAIYARIKEVGLNGKPNVHDVWISYLFFSRYTMNGQLVFEEGYCLQWAEPPVPDLKLDLCSYIAKNPGVNPGDTRLSDPATPANNPLGEQLAWTVNTYPESPDFPPANTMQFICETCTSCPMGYFSNAGDAGDTGGMTKCNECPIGFYAGVVNSAICKSCPSGYHGIAIQASSCELCRNGKYSEIHTNDNEKGIVECENCLVGRYSIIPGSMKCKSCPSGYYQDRIGSDTCVMCSDGSISDQGSIKCTECPSLSYVYKSNTSGIFINECVPCPKCTLNPIKSQRCGTCNSKKGFVQNEGFWNQNRTVLSTSKLAPLMSVSSFSSPSLVRPPSLNEIFLPCDVIGFKDYEEDDVIDDITDNKHSNGTAVKSNKVKLVFNFIRQEDTACHVNSNGSQICKNGYQGFLCGACAITHGHNSRKSTCKRCDKSNVGPWIRMSMVIIFGMCIVGYIVKRKTRKQSASLERVGLLYFQFTGYALALAVNWPSYVHVFLQVESSVGNANSFSYADVECSFKNHLLFGSWFYTYCLIVLLGPIIMISMFIPLYILTEKCCRTDSSKATPQNSTETSTQSDTISVSVVSMNTDDSLNSLNNLSFSSSLSSRLINICVIVMYLMWSWCSLTILQVIFDCTDKGDGIKRLAFDLEQHCYTGNHQTFLFMAAIPGFIVYVIGAPVYLSLILWRVRHRLGDQEVLARYGFLLAGYRRERYYWEMIIMLRRFCVVLAAVALDEMLLLQLAVSSLICLLFLLAHVTYKPYATDEATLLSRLNAAMCETLGEHDVRNMTNIELVHLSRKVSTALNNREETEENNGEEGKKNSHGLSSGPNRQKNRSHSHGLLREMNTEISNDKKKTTNPGVALQLQPGSSPPKHPSTYHRTSESTSTDVSSVSTSSLKRITSLPKITARSVALYGEKVYNVEMYALVTNYFTFYLVSFSKL